MRNLAASPNESVRTTLAVHAELQRAGIPAFHLDLRNPQRPPEVPTQIVGALTFLGADYAFSRAWYYWMVNGSKPVPEEVARQFNARWGAVVRVDGYAGGKDVDGPVDHWHVDTEEGLHALVHLLRTHFGVTVNRPPRLGHVFACATPGCICGYSFVKDALVNDGIFDVLSAKPVHRVEAP